MKPFAEIWHGTVEEILNAYPDHDVLSEEEIARQGKLLFEKDQRALQAAHLLKRNMLTQFSDLKPSEFDFDRGTYGRPEIKKGTVSEPIFFNISHKQSAVCCLVSNIPECGVDLEDNTREVDWKAISEKVFTPSEIRYCESKDQRFRNLWCLKEAYMKATGLGFHIDPLSLIFLIKNRDIILKDHLDWQFSLHNIGNKYTIATALHFSDQVIKPRIS